MFRVGLAALAAESSGIGVFCGWDDGRPKGGRVLWGKRQWSGT